jgi:hypothetical protein
MKAPPVALTTVFGALPDTLRRELIDAFGQIVKNFPGAAVGARRTERRKALGGRLLDSCGLRIRHLPEAREEAEPHGRRLPEAGAGGGGRARSISIQIPRMLIALYEIRNNRNVGHVGSDVDPNHMDAVCVLQMSKWVMAELARVLHELSTQEATAIVDSLVERETPLIWEVNGRKRVLNTNLNMRDKTFLLLHASSGAVGEAELVSWIEHSNASVYRRDVLRPAHRSRYLKYDEKARDVQISPRGIEYVEENLLPTLA